MYYGVCVKVVGCALQCEINFHILDRNLIVAVIDA